MGVGKTTTAEAVAHRLERPLSDSDAEISRLAGVDGNAVADRLGIPALHQVERAVLIAALARPEPHVIAAAASVVEDPTVRELLGAAVVVRVDAAPAVVHERQATGDHRRPMSLEELEALASRREPLFAEVESLRLDGTAPTDQLVDEVVDHLDHQMS
jgi:shikimate kinase